ncbi:MAG: type II secretion system F family protein [Oscillospiraceae bacterium]|nr:type II secretion system F family protein [Oscillospiraceae bacterium]MDD4414249.1 type II secretion system F family protein [Oscillospiraceae bacterium]
MPEFRYSVMDSKGQTLSGIMEADDQDVCRKLIAQRGLYCIEVAPVSLAQRSISFGGKSKIKPKELTVFCRQFSTMMISGISVIKCLDILHSQADNATTKEVIKKVYEGVQRGQSLSAALAGQDQVFPDFMINMVEAGEASGTLDRVMERLADHFEKNLKTANKVKNAMTYPIILGMLTVSVVIILMIFVLPVFIEMFETSGVKLPLPTRILVGISNSLTGYWFIYLIIISAVSLAWIRYLKNENGRLKWDRYKVNMPIIGKLNLIIISAQFARTMSTMMQSGIPLLKSLEITSRVLGNKYYEKCLVDIGEDIRKGISLSSSIKKADIFPILMTSMISIGEESGTLEDILVKTSLLYDEESDAAISKLVGMLEPLMIIIMALVVGFVVISIIVPMFSMMSLVNG